MVVAIIGLVLGIVAPGISSMWNQRLEAQAENIVSGVLRSVQVQARSSGERGLFFYLEDGVQKMVIIRAAHNNPGVSPDNASTLPQVTADCFEPVPGTVTRVPAPYRVAPRGLALGAGSNLAFEWEDSEIMNENYRTAPGTGNQRHRNFFTLVFGPDGRLLVGRDVLVYDPDLDNNGRGDLTGLAVGAVTTYYDGAGDPQDLPLVGNDVLEFMVTDGDAAINFPGVDGLLVYDESLWQELPDAPQRRQWCVKNAKPYYVSRLSGSVIRGPVGE